LRHTKGYPPIRTIARHTNLSPATVSRIFTGSTLPSWESIKQVLKALDGSATDVNRRRAAWVSATHTGEVGRQAHRKPVGRLPGAADIEINRGTMHISDAALTAGKSIEVNDGHPAIHRRGRQGRRPNRGQRRHGPHRGTTRGLAGPNQDSLRVRPRGHLLALPAGKPADNTGTVPFLRRAQ
jgi:transcriptional regulator with XRE-family HTH domain